MSGLTAFFLAVSGVSLVIFFLMKRSDRARDRRGAYADGSGGDVSFPSSDEGRTLLGWFGGNSSSSDSSGTSSDSGSFSSDSGGDGGGGGGGGGDGGGD